jgi:hypothetical protein
MNRRRTWEASQGWAVTPHRQGDHHTRKVRSLVPAVTIAAFFIFRHVCGVDLETTASQVCVYRVEPRMWVMSIVTRELTKRFEEMRREDLRTL